MEEQHSADDQSHYEISLTAGQAFVAFVLLLLSLAASFAFGLMIGKGQADERLVVKKESTPVVTEASAMPKKPSGRIVELGVADDDFQASDTAAATDTSVTAPATDEATAATISEAEVNDSATSAAAPATTPQAQQPQPQTQPQSQTQQAAVANPQPATTAPPIPHFAQLLSTSDQKTAEALAARLIDRGFTSAYVERGTTEKGPVFRVRIRFPNESDARAAEPKLREFSKDVWIAK
ncbi:MAG TPA: SPOR domain-containing protein [Thermoanaerobaculia bacterium]